MSLRPSHADTKSLPTAEMSIKWFSLSWVICLNMGQGRNVHSLVALVAGITKISFMRVTISENMHLEAGNISETIWTNDCFLLAL